MGYVSIGMGDCFSALLMSSIGFAARTSKPKPILALFFFQMFQK